VRLSGNTKPWLTLVVSLLNKMVRYHFKDRYQSATEVPASAATTSRALLANTASSSTITNCYSTASCPKAWAGHANSALQRSWLTQMILLSKQICFADWAGVVSAALMVVSYYSLQPPVPASKFQRYPVSAPSKKNTAIGKFSSQHLMGIQTRFGPSPSARIAKPSLVAVEDDQTLESQHWRTAALSLGIRIRFCPLP